MLETINYNKVNPMGSKFNNGRKYKIYFFFDKKLRIPRSLVLNTNGQFLSNYSRF